jgi:hypothetical protein
MDREAKIKSLIDSGKFNEGHRAFLTTAPDDVLETLTASIKTQPQTPVGATAGASEQTVEQYLSAAPASVREELKAAHTAMQAKRTSTISALKATGRCTFTDEQLATKSNQELEQLAALAQVPTAADFSARGVALSTGSDDAIPEPPSLITAVQNARSKK